MCVCEKERKQKDLDRVGRRKRMRLKYVVCKKKKKKEEEEVILNITKKSVMSKTP